jgi:hypothetical protein
MGTLFVSAGYGAAWGTHLSGKGKSGSGKHGLPQRARTRWSITPERATITAALIALLGTLVTAIVAAQSADHPTPAPTPTVTPTLSAIELVGVSAEERGHGSVFLDVLTRNTGDKTSILKGAVARVDHWRKIETCTIGGPLPVSSTYQMKLPVDPDAQAFDMRVPLHEYLRPNEVDRIKIEVGLDEADPFIDGMIFRLRLSLEVDRNGSALSEPVLLSLPGPLSPASHWHEMEKDSEAYSKDCARSNLAGLGYMLALDGDRSHDLSEMGR